MGPFRKLLIVAFGARASLRIARQRYDADPESQATLDVTLSRHEAMSQIHHEMLRQLPQAGQVAMESQLRIGAPADWQALVEPGAPPIDPTKHPFLAWLLSPEGIAWVMSIVNYVLTNFFHLTPLPPFPTAGVASGHPLNESFETLRNIANPKPTAKPRR